VNLLGDRSREFAFWVRVRRANRIARLNALWAWLAEANTSAAAPSASWIASSEEGARLSSTFTEGWATSNSTAIWPKASLRDAAANTTSSCPPGGGAQAARIKTKASQQASQMV